MSKINIKAILNNLTDKEIFNVDTKGILIDKKIKYIDNHVNVVVEIKNNLITIDRCTDEYHIYMEFDRNNITNGIYEINSLGSFDLRVETKELEIINNEISIKYSMYIDNSKQDFEYKIIYKEM